MLHQIMLKQLPSMDKIPQNVTIILDCPRICLFLEMLISANKMN